MTDILLHVAGAAALMALACAGLLWAGWPAGVWVAALVNAGLWTAREALQARRKERYGGGAWAMPWRWSRQKILEAAAPAAAGLAVAAAAAMIAARF